MNNAYLLKESFSQLWEYRSEGWARRFFDNWRPALRWQQAAFNFAPEETPISIALIKGLI